MKKSNQAFHLLIIAFAMAITAPVSAQQKSKPNISCESANKKGSF